ncbi:hypothetical protein GJ744_007185 [Endocarpon pusillum]|uniref:Ras GTPase-activating-like protein rng2 n=1 Tax=Endocarpon pusillum TaxID=364733 RepID=A0A8H7AN93_9EURO|nr:hypothetical protein GJ744_007185 [Endocarpon pusillum]
MTSAASSTYLQERAGHKRGISEASGVASRYTDRSSVECSPDHFYSHARQSLRPLPQAPAASPPAKRHSPNHVRQETNRYSQHQQEDPLVSDKTRRPIPDGRLEKAHIHHAHSNPHSSAFVTPDFQELQKSSTGHLRALSKFAQSDQSEDFSITTPAPSVVGLHNRRQLKRTDSTARGKPQKGRGGDRNYGWAERNWMDKQRQFLQAYEYLCHIGEAKEWIEDVIHKPIPPIVQLEEALRDGVTLAEIVQAVYPQQRLRIFRHQKLQFRHSDNIALFFRFLEDVELPDLFRFELIDLYEKKNIPKVIYCIHALSWLLYRKGIVDFRIGNLVGQLEFDHHDLEQTQKGLDKAGVNMPSFAGMGASFGAEPEPPPEPEPVESEDDRVDRELREHEAIILDFQTQAKGALLRMKLGDRMAQLWDAETMLIDLQARIRGDWARQIIGYRLSMQRFAITLQSTVRGYLARSRGLKRERWWKSKEREVLALQSLARARRTRADIKNLKTQARREDSGIRIFQAAVRGALARREVCDQYEATREVEGVVEDIQSVVRGMLTRRDLRKQDLILAQHAWSVGELQAVIRGMLVRQNLQRKVRVLEQHGRSVALLQAAARALLERRIQSQLQGKLLSLSSLWTTLQAIIRGNGARTRFVQIKAELQHHSSTICHVQAYTRGAIAREECNALRLALFKQLPTIVQVQSQMRGSLLRRKVVQDQEALQAESAVITRLQSLGRGAIERQRVGGLLNQLDLAEAETVLLQGLIRAMFLRSQVGDVLAELESQEDTIIELQSATRASIVRSRYEEKKRFFKENMEKVVKIQSIVRAKIQGEAYKSLTNGKNPPVGTLKGFVHLLNDSDFDFDEEIEFERLRKTVVQHVRQNELADQYITQLDIKIALLVKNKITLDEVVKHQRHFGGHVGTLLPNSDMSSKDPFDLKALNKASRRKLEHYQELFFLLQTQPQYLARLFRRIREHATADKECERIKHLMMGLFGYAQKRREEYYLVKLIVRSLKEEVDNAHSMQDYLRSNAFWNRMFGAYIKSPRDRKFMRDVLGGIIKENFIDNRQLDLESDPMQIYLSAINNEELRTGKRSRRSPNVPREEAIRDPETRATFIHHMQDLRDITDQFFVCIEDLLHRMPFGVRFIAQQTHECLLARFQEEEPGYILQIVGQWMWKNYLQPALTEPEKYGVVDRGLTQEQKRNIGEVAKVLGQAASGKEFGGDNIYLQPLNTYIREAMYRFGEIWSHVISVPPAEEHYDIDEFNDLYAKTKPTLYIKMADIFSIHQLITTELPHVCPVQDDVLRDVIRELGSVKSNENELMSVSSNEISLTLNPKLHNAEDPDAEIKALFTETKRCVLYIIRVQAGTNLLDILVKPVTAEDIDRWETLVREELRTDGRKRVAYSEANTHVDISSLSYVDLKRIALENVLQLEDVGKLTRRNHYQDLLNAIAVDIRTKHRRRIQRQRELEGVRTTLARLNEQAVYLEQQLKTYNDYIEQAMVTLQSKKGKKRFIMPFTKQWDHERELQRTGRSFKFGSYKYSARNLADKGVLVHWKGYLERQWDRVDLTISSNEVGVFTIDGSSGNMMVPGANAQVPLDDLLQAQFNNTQFMDFFEGSLRVNVNLFLHLIMKKFYNE